jgi:carbohydrate-binding DOMON domain-containing protein
MYPRLKYCIAAMSVCLASGTAFAEEYVFTDPTGDDNGPGNYVYPTDAVYTPGSFDLTELKVEHKGGNVTFETSVNQKLQDPWGMGVGFAVQMMFIFIDTDGAEGSGHTEGLPGLNIQFAPGSAWEKVVVLSPQPQSRVQAEVRTKAAAMGDDIIVPRRTTGRGKTISGKVKLDELGGGDPSTWRYQVVVQSNEGFPEKTDLLTRKVNEFEGQHRFGGGNDYNCDPHVMDILAPPAQGTEAEIQAQHEMLAYECDEEGNAVKMATLEMVGK